MSRPFSPKAARSAVLLCSLFAATCATPAARAAVSFDDVKFWAGSGSNRAALVIDFNDAKGPESLVWGYRWNGSATGEDLFRAVVEADPRLFAKRKAFSFGTVNLGIGYDTNSNGFAISDGTPFDPATGVALGNENQADGATPTDAADHYREGWFTAFFNYYTSGSSPFGGGGMWTESQVGLADRALTDGSWDGLSFAPGFTTTLPDEPTAAAVPEPSLLTLTWVGGLGLVAGRSRRASRHV